VVANRPCTEFTESDRSAPARVDGFQIRLREPWLQLHTGVVRKKESELARLALSFLSSVFCLPTSDIRPPISGIAVHCTAVPSAMQAPVEAPAAEVPPGTHRPRDLAARGCARENRLNRVRSCPASRKPPVPHAAWQITHRGAAPSPPQSPG